MTRSIRRNSLIVTIPLAAIAAGWAVFVFVPIQKAISRLDDESKEMREYCSRAQALLPVLKRSGRDLSDVRTRVSRWEETTPSRRQIPELLGEISSAARSTGLRTTQFNPEPLVAYERVAQMPLSMGVTGTFSQVFAFLYQLESMSPPIWIDRLEVEKGKGVRGLVSLQLDLVVFVDNPKDSGQISESVNR